MTRAPVLLSGMMGVGKSAVGGRVAALLGRRFVDLDRDVEERAGRTVAEIFAADGEATFRALEREALEQQLHTDDGPVVALGGGALLDGPLRARALEQAVVVGLGASVATLRDRLEGDHAHRPLLAGDGLEARLTELVDRRRHVYTAPFIKVTTDGRPIDDIAEEVARRAAADDRLLACSTTGRRLMLLTEAGPCPLTFGKGMLPRATDVLLALGFAPGPVLVVVDEGAQPHGDAVVASLEQAGFVVTRALFAGGEANKTPAALAALWSSAASARIARDRPFVAVGGGVCGDVVGFAAATYQRGVPLVQVPTTLLAMVDASVGGKTAVDLPEGKNLAGAFHQASAVLLDRDTLKTLPIGMLRQGVAEMVKHALIEGEPALAQLEHAATRPFEHALDDDGWLDERLLQASVRVKAEVVAADYREGGQRRLLNLGHTFGHALELLTDFKVAHGDAVALGLCTALRFGDDVDALALLERVVPLLRWAALPTHLDDLPGLDRAALSARGLVDAMGTDKKRKAGRLHLVLVHRAGQAFVHPVDDDAALLAAWIASGALPEANPQPGARA